MSDSNLNDAKVYTEHLSEVNKINTVKATENIYNQKGVLLVAKGVEISGSIAEKMAQHKLSKPIEHSININDMVDAQALYSHILKRIGAREDYRQIHTHFKLDKPLLAACEYYSRYNILVQKITVLSSQIEYLYEQAIVGAWFALAISRELQNSDIDPREVFLVALVRDIGYLHLPRNILEDKPRYSIAEQNAIKSHPLVAKLILDELKEIPDRIKIAAVEHHERCDGAGFPKGKVDGQLSLLGQVVAMADELQFLTINSNSSEALWVGNLQPFLNLNMTTHFKETFIATSKLIKNAQLIYQRVISDEDMPEYIATLLKQQKKYINLNESLSLLLPKLNPTTNKLEEKLIISFSHRIQRILIESGVLSDEYSRWINHVAEQKLIAAYEEMESIALMYQELAKQFKQIIRNIDYLLSDYKNDFGSREDIEANFEEMNIIFNRLKTCLN